MLGVLILAVFLAALLGVPLPMIANDREAFLAITLIAVVKVGITAIDGLMNQRV